MTPAELREIVLERDQGCRWPGCDLAVDGFANRLELAHISHRGMGGNESKNTEDGAIMLCRTHHDCLDGRTGLGILRLELNKMLRVQIGKART